MAIKLKLKSTSLVELYYDHFEPIRLRTRRVNTKRLYHSTLRTFERFLNRTPELADLNNSTVARFLSWLKDNEYSAGTINKEWANLGAIWRWAYHRRVEFGEQAIDEFPELENLPLPEQVPQAWNKYQLRRLFNTIDKQTGRIGEIPAAAWWRSLHLVLWDSGERIGALLAAEWSWFDLEQGWLFVPAEHRKGGRKAGKYKLGSDTVASLKRILKPPRTLVWPWPHTPTYLYNRYEILLGQAGLPTDRKSKFHRMRRSFASHAEAAGLNATALLQHTSRKTTESYLDPRIAKPPSAVDVLFRPSKSAVEIAEAVAKAIELPPVADCASQGDAAATPDNAALIAKLQALLNDLQGQQQA